MDSAILEIILIIIGLVWIVLFYLWLALGRKVKSKTGTLLIDTVLITFSMITIFLAMLLRQEYLKGRLVPDCNAGNSTYVLIACNTLPGADTGRWQ